MTHNLVIQTYVDNGVIVQDTYSDIEGVRQRIMREMADTKDAQIRQVLINMGWTPPPTEALA